MTPEKIEQIKHLRQVKRYRVNDIARLAGVTVEDVRLAMRLGHGNTEVGEEQVIDGEPIAERIARMTAIFKEQQLADKRASEWDGNYVKTRIPGMGKVNK